MKRVSIGGQAVLEGVMMKGPDSYALAVRKPDKEIEVKTTEYKSLGERYKVLTIPILRGVVNFIESLYIGMKTLMDSSEYMLEEEEGVKTDSQNIETNNKESEKKSSGDTFYMVGTLIVTLAITIGIFMLLPAFIANFLHKVTDSEMVVNLAEGILRLLIFMGYVVCISFMKDIKRTFMYHGAEHKTINCMEAGDDLTVANVQKHTRFHRRCGTSFVFIVMFISIAVFMFVKTDTLLLRLVSRILLVPVIAGISYEFIRYAGLHDNFISRFLSAPGLWVQRLTTKEPDDDMVEVAIRSVEGVVDWHEYTECVRNNSFE
ncbi:MAG: DUF1385 domain-containing protein [Eubacterium sp.]|nr:DUF1385 domain-containing protein [Eubacterium sp.]